MAYHLMNELCCIDHYCGVYEQNNVANSVDDWTASFLVMKYKLNLYFILPLCELILFQLIAKRHLFVEFPILPKSSFITWCELQGPFVREVILITFRTCFPYL